ncbi:MAG: T9SS type A sorting domain-containing protein, partial [Candidatus Marinimicrobia bacterium]|nr:T9SS type A sorting domain-containing protein [Candidatus Neomarinimicrobiota bacterium]
MPLYYQVSSIDDAGNESPKTNEALVNATNLSWYVNVRADLGGDINDNDNFLGVANDATNAFDVNYDILEPPFPPNGYVALYFPHTGWNHALGDNFTQDVKPDIALNDTLQVWNFDVISDQAGMVDLTFNLSEGFPENATIILKNIKTSESFLIADGATVSFAIATGNTESFTISIGNNVPNKPLDVSLNTPSTTGFASLTWTDNSEIEKGYIVYNSADGTSFSFVDSLPANSISFTGDALTNLDINTQYWFKVTSYNVAAESEGAIDSLYTLSNIPSTPIITDSTLTTISISVDENNNPVNTEFAIGITGGSFGQTTHYVQSDGSVLEATSQFWAAKETWGTKTVTGLIPETFYSFKVKSRNGNNIESQFGQSASKSTGSYPTVSLINPVGPAILQSNSTYSVNWILSNPSFVDSVFVYYSSDSGTTYDLCKSLSNVNTCSWTTPSEYLNYGGKIKVSIKDESGQYRYDESYRSFVVVGDSLSNSVQTGWTLWGVPLSPYVSSITDNLGDDFSGGWWSFDYLNGGYTINSALIAGEGYWLATDADAVLDVKGQPATSATTFDLTKGWELITNPLVTDVNKDSLLVTKDNSTISFSDAVTNEWISSVFYHYNPSLGGYEMCDILEPWKGYWFGVADSGVSVTFTIHSVSDQLAKSNQLAKSTVSDTGWTVQLEINAGSVQDMALFGVDKNATDDFDTFFDTPKPPIPPSPDYVYMSFKHPDWHPVFGENYVVDIRSPLGDSDIKEWMAQLISTVEDEPITISWTLEDFPEDIDLALDLGAGLINMKEQDNIEISYSSEAISCIFKAGESLLSIFDENVIPKEFSLLQNYPNPFNPTTTICYGLPATKMVSLKIYDINGRIVASLVNEKQQAGWYSVQWNGLTESGNSLSTGLYFYRIQAGNFSEAKKMLFIK